MTSQTKLPSDKVTPLRHNGLVTSTHNLGASRKSSETLIHVQILLGCEDHFNIPEGRQLSKSICNTSKVNLLLLQS